MYVFRSTMYRVLRLYLNANKQMILRFCSTVVFIVIMHRLMLTLQWFDQHSKYAPFSDGLPIKKYNDGGKLE